MATPQMLVQAINSQQYHNSPGSVRINTFNPDGSPLDVSSGYAVSGIILYPTSSPNGVNGGVNVTSNMSGAFDTTGVTLSWTGAQGNTILADMQALFNGMAVYLTNDSGTTKSLAALGQFNLDPNAVIY